MRFATRRLKIGGRSATHAARCRQTRRDERQESLSDSDSDLRAQVREALRDALRDAAIDARVEKDNTQQKREVAKPIIGNQ